MLELLSKPAAARENIMSRHKVRNTESKNVASAYGGSDPLNPARIYAVPEVTRHLDPAQLAKLEQDFRSWSAVSSRSDIIASRKRILLIFLLIRYTGARLHEVLTLDLAKHIDATNNVVRYSNAGAGERSSRREVQISSELTSEIQETLADRDFATNVGTLLEVDEGHVRRKFYERAMACGFPQDLGSPNAIRRARAVELMQSNVPLPVVQRVLGHSTPNLTASFIAFSEEDIHQVARHFIEKESGRKTSARNTFFGKIGRIRRGDIQSEIELLTMGGETVTTVITNNSLKKLGLKVGSLVTAEVKAPWVVIQKSDTEPLCTAENLFCGSVIRILRGKRTTEVIVRISDGTELCSVVTEESRRKLNLKEDDNVWVMFNSFAVILHVN
jgi:molybdate transport system regulatory protein